jgi:hypothetical protein
MNLSFGQTFYCAPIIREVEGDDMGLRDAFRRRVFKGGVVGAIDRKYRINLRAEIQHLSTPTLDDMLNKLYDSAPTDHGVAVAGVLPQVEKMLAGRGVNPARLGESAELRRKMGRRRPYDPR